MLKIGFIGTGNMGTILIEALIDGKAASPASITITNRTIEKAYHIQDKYKDIQVVDSPSKVVSESELIFVCVKPLDVPHIIETIQPYLLNNQCLVTITSPISVTDIEKRVSCSVARVIPSITNRALSGVSLLSFGENCTENWRIELEQLLCNFSIPVYIKEELTRVASDIVSCGPAFFSYLAQRFINAAVHETKIDEGMATQLTGEMLIGLGELLRKGYYTLPTLQEKVCVKGGITGKGIHVLEQELGEVFEHLFIATHQKFAEDILEVQKQFHGS